MPAGRIIILINFHMYTQKIDRKCIDPGGRQQMDHIIRLSFRSRFVSEIS
jgi:hypothetical protein